MRETIYLRVSRNKVEGMTKKMPGLYKGELPVKLNIEIPDKSFGTPTIEKDVRIDTATPELTAADLNIKSLTITETEFAKIKEERRTAMIEQLQSDGFTVTAPEEAEE
jgi:hypothetical protein